MVRRPSRPYSAAMNRTDLHARLVTRACRRIEDADTPPPLAELAREAGLSTGHFQRLFKAHTGVTPHAYAQGQRIGRLRASLAREARITDAIHDAGFNSASRYYTQSRAWLGMTATRWRAGGAGAPAAPARPSASRLPSARWARSWSPKARRACARSRWATHPSRCCASCRTSSRAPAWSVATPPSSAAWHK